MILDYQRTGFIIHILIVKNKHSRIVYRTVLFFIFIAMAKVLFRFHTWTWQLMNHPILLSTHTSAHLVLRNASAISRWFRSSASSKSDPELVQIRNLFRADKALKMSKTNLRPRMHPEATLFFLVGSRRQLKKGFDTIWIWYTNNCDGCFEINDQY